MKKLFALIGVAALLATVSSATAQTQTNSTPTVQGGLQQIVDAMKSGETNWWGEAHGLYAPGLQNKYGGGVGAFWNLSQYVYTGIRVDYVNGGFWMPSGSATMQLPVKVFSWLQFAPLAYVGVGVPLSGATVGSVTLPGQTPKDNNGQATAILGYGAALRVANIHSSSSWVPAHVDLIYDRETWTGFSGQQNRFGLAANWLF